MSSPAEGYFDEQGNFIPGSFAEQLDLPGPSEPDQAAIARAEGELATEKARGKKTGTRLTVTESQIKRLEAKLKTKGLSAKQKKALNRQLSTLRITKGSQAKLLEASKARQTTLQSKVYEVSGEYEKLLEGANRDAYASLRSLFNQFGLGSLAPKIYEYAKQGYGADVISLLLQDTTEYKERFQGNAARAKAGLAVLTPAEYLATEEAYRQILQDAGLPKGFYDNPADFANWIGTDVSPTEVKGRADLAVQNSVMANPAAKQALQQLYGVDESYVAAYFLDRKRALPLLQKQSQAALFGGEAMKRNLLDINKDFLEYMATSGLTQSQVQQGYEQIAQTLPALERIAGRWGETFSQREAESDVFAPESGLYGATEKRKRLASQERGLFAGRGGATPGGLASMFQQT